MQTAITGNTYPVKDELKALGARWNADKKAWMIDESKAGRAREIVASAPRKAPAGAVAARGSNYDRFNGYGARRGGYRKACVSGGNCSSFGSGRSCGGHDCDGY